MKKLSSFGLLLLLALTVQLSAQKNSKAKSVAVPPAKSALELFAEEKMSIATDLQAKKLKQKDLDWTTKKVFREYQQKAAPEVNEAFRFAGEGIHRCFGKTDASEERRFVVGVLGKLQDRAYFNKQLAEVDAMTEETRKIVGYLSLIKPIVSALDLQEQISWINPSAIQAAMNDMVKMKGYNATANKVKLDELKTLLNKGFKGIYSNDQQAIADAKKAIALKRDILLANPLLDFDKLIVGRYKMGTLARSANPSAMGTPPNNWSNQTSAQQSGFNAQIDLLTNLRGEVKGQTLYKPEHSTSVPDLKLNWNADKMLFTMAEKGDHHWQVYEMDINTKSVKQVTQGGAEDLDFFDACYLPNGKLIVNSNIGGQGVPCVNGSDQVGNFCLFDPNTKDMRRLTFDQDANWGPVVMHNGRIMYIRWEYTDLTHYFSRIVMHMNPDGTEQRSLYGSGSVFPTSILDVTPLPEHPTRFVGVISGHHGVVRSGRLIIFDPAINRKEEKGMVQELPYKGRKIIPIVKDQMVNGVWPQFLKPQPLGNDYFVVTAKLNNNGLWGLYLIDTFDNLTLIAEYEGEGLIYGLPVKQTTMPPVIPDKVDLKQKEATVFIQDLYEGEGLPGVKRGEVKELRVFAYEYAYIKSLSNHTAQGIQSGWDIKRLLGTVPVEPDGSVMFKIPANTPISLQPIDKDGAAIQWMRSWLTGMPGETVSCVGCHEDQNQIPMPKRAIASTKAPQQMKTPEGGIRSFTFDLEIQPILDRNCISCHNGEKSKLNFTGGRKDKNGYGLSYLELHPFVHRQGPEAGMKVLYPYEYHVSNSQLIRMLKDGHYDVKLTDKETKTLYNWIDFNAPDKGTFEATQWHSDDQKSRRIKLNEKYANGIAVNWEKEIKDYAAYLEQQPKAEPAKVNFKEKKFKEVKLKGFPFEAKETVERKEIEIAPGKKLTFVKVPAGQFVMGKNIQNSNAAPAFKAKIAKAFWMSEKEITNDQLRTFVEHDSRYVDMQWKDHVNEGYEANDPEQVASRVSYNQAVEFCQKASQKLGIKMTIPTETQWEWACRAGSGEDFWFGNLNTDFAKFENFADKQTLKLAVVGVDPQPMPKNHPWYDYHIWLPKVESVDDGNMIMSLPGSYQANGFGLYDMHGNVAEWTSSDYTPYPLNPKNSNSNGEKVVRGGSWKDHPKYSTAYYRKPFLPEQRPFNVGFRVIIEE